MTTAVPSSAGPDPGVINGTTATFTGNQADGIRIIKDTYSPSIDKLVIRDFTSSMVVPKMAVQLQFLQTNRPHGGSLRHGADGLHLDLDFDPGAWLTASHTPGSIIVSNLPQGAGIIAESRGGNGGNGKDGGLFSSAGDGGNGGAGGNAGVQVLTPDPLAFSLVTFGHESHAVAALSAGGQGGKGGDKWVVGDGGEGGAGGLGGTVTAAVSAGIRTHGDNAVGVVAQSLGGTSGAGGTGGGVWGNGGDTHGSGTGGAVATNVMGRILTFGSDSHAVVAQSLGGYTRGAGGAGGFWATAGDGGASGDGGAVTVWSDAWATTSGLGAYGLHAQSVGGGGGSAGEAGGIVAIGGEAGGGGDGGSINVSNGGGIVTSGGDGVGVFAQSVGGGGGRGGGAGGAISVGGSGALGGDGGVVSATNHSFVTTSGNDSDGIFAQSLGGGGGRARASGGTSLTSGGRGARGGNGKEVTVINHGPLQTSGHSASAIFGQSTGGGGGSGGGAYGSGSALSITVGGNAGGAGHSGKVNITSRESFRNPPALETFGHLSHGIHAQAIGGGGGRGGSLYSLTGSFIGKCDLNVGGRGAGGGHGGEVTVETTSPIITHGLYSHGLLAESIGGGGGSGGDVFAGSVLVGYRDIGVSKSMHLGGNGSGGGNGKTVLVANHGSLTTSAHGSHGVFAQSIGGGGGNGGSAVTGGISIGALSDMSLAVGGRAGGGGDGGRMSVVNTGDIHTQAHSAYGILAQSVGGGGGTGGNSIVLALDLPMARSLKSLKEEAGGSPTPELPNLNFRTAVGGVGGNGGDCSWGSISDWFGTVDVANDGPISTRGVHSHGILAQGIGGGGGAAGNNLVWNIDSDLSPDDLAAAAKTLLTDSDFSIGSYGGIGGDGGAVRVKNRNTIETGDDFASGILAQSIGGGGGLNGVTVEDPGGLLKSAGSSLKLRLNANGGGEGWPVWVENHSRITTAGAFAHGIHLQSIGGGGGVVAVSERRGLTVLDLPGLVFGTLLNPTAAIGAAYAGSAGGTGNAGYASAYHTGDITTTGPAAHGIFGQSTAGSGRSSLVQINASGTITVHGEDSHGILAQTTGLAGELDIRIEISGGTIQGGSAGGAAVSIRGGRSSRVLNAGHLWALSGTAIKAAHTVDWYTVTIENSGTVTGNVLLSYPQSAQWGSVFDNLAGGTFNSGPLVDLGPGRPIQNAGTFAPGGVGAIATTALVGNFVNLPGGVLRLDLGGAAPEDADQLVVAGDITCGGTLELNFSGGYLPQPGHPHLILNASSHTGRFDQVLATGLAGGLGVAVNYDTVGQITVSTVVLPQFVKKDTAPDEPLTDPAGWIGEAVPTAAHIARFDATMASAANHRNPIGGDLSLLGIMVADPRSSHAGGGYILDASMDTAPPFSYCGTLFIGAAGIDLSTASAPAAVTDAFFTIKPPVFLTSHQVWQVPRLATLPARELALCGATAVAERHSADFDLGGHILLKDGAGIAGVYGDRTTANGTLRVNGGTFEFANSTNPGIAAHGALGTSSASVTDIIQEVAASLQVAVDPGGTLNLACAPTHPDGGVGALNWHAPIRLNGGILMLNGGNYLGQLALDGALTAAGDTTSEIHYTVASTMIPPILATLRGPITGSGGLIIRMDTARGQDRLVLAADNSAFQGDLLIASGHVVAVNSTGSATGSGMVTVGASATLGGSGRTGPAKVHGTLRPGIHDGDTATLTTGGTTLTGTLIADINGDACDLLIVDGALDIVGATIQPVVGISGFTAASYVLATATSITWDWEALHVADGYSAGVVSVAGGQQLMLISTTAAYIAWAASEITGSDPTAPAGFGADADGDGIPNGLEWILCGRPLVPDAAGLVTVRASGAGGLTLVFRRNPDSLGMAGLAVEWTTDPGAGFPHAIPIGASDVLPEGNRPVVAMNTPAAGFVTVTIPAANAANGRIFARFKGFGP